MPIPTKFDKRMYVTAYEYAREGLSDTRIAKAIGVAPPTFLGWVAKDEVLEDALTRGRRSRDPGDEYALHNYIYDHLSPHLQKLWAEIDECETLENGMERVEALFARAGIRARQHLFLYALTQTTFNISKCMRKLGIPRKMYDNWVANDAAFAELVDEMHWHKKNFIENSLLRRVAIGDTPAVIHAAKTMLRDRGYGDKIEVEHTGTVLHKHAIEITALDLPVETLATIYAAMEAHEKANELTAPTQPALTFAGAD